MNWFNVFLMMVVAIVVGVLLTLFFLFVGVPRVTAGYWGGSGSMIFYFSTLILQEALQ